MMVEYFIWNVQKDDEKNKRIGNFGMQWVLGVLGERKNRRDFERMLAYGWYGVRLVFCVMM